jgi:hypothetical protein
MNSKSEKNNPRRLMMRCNTGWIGRFVAAMVMMAAVGFMAGGAQAALVNVDINKGLTFDGGGLATSWSPTFDGDAVVDPGVPSQTWNALNQPNNSNPSTGSLLTLLDSEGNASAVTLSAFKLPNGDFRDNTGANNLKGPDGGWLNLFADRPAGGGQASVTISGLADGAWDLYVFGWAGSPWTVTDGVQTPVTEVWFPLTYDGSDPYNPSALVEGATHVHFSGTHVAGTDLVLTSSTAGGEINGHGQVRWSGFQINQIPLGPLAPTLDIADNNVDENLAVGSAAGSLSVANTNATFSFSLVEVGSFPDNTSFTLGGVNSSNVLTAAVFDKETKDPYSIRVLATETSGGSLQLTNTFTITVNDVAEVGGAMIARGEVQTGLTLAGTLEVLLDSSDSSVTYAVAGATYHGAMFEIAGSGDELHLKAAPSAGELADEYFVEVTATGDTSGAYPPMLIKVTVVSGTPDATIFIFN